tara:strand:+ start:639 stop:1442 length:804 start_codon:yes stop_codon:yes gene_type:complete
MTSTIHADKIMNSSGDQDSGLDLLVNDQVKIKTANTDRVIIDSSGRVGIGTTSPTDALHVKGFAQIESNAGDAAYLRFDNDVNSGGKIWRTGAGLSAHGTFSIYNQTDNKFGVNVTSDGYVLKPNNPCFIATLGASQSIPDQQWTKINLATELLDVSNSYDYQTNYRFTAPVTGNYFFTGTVNIANSTVNAGYFYTALAKNGSIYDYLVGFRPDNNTHFQSDNQSNGGIVIPLSTGDYVELWVYVNWATSGSVTGSSRCKMTGFLIG